LRPGRTELAALGLLLAPSLAVGWEARTAPHLEMSGPTRTAVLEPRIRIVSWNVHKRTDPVFLSELSRLLDSVGADIVLLQECASRDPQPFAIALAGRSWALSSNLRTGSPPVETGVATASRSIHRSRALLSEGAEPVVGSRKAALATWHPSATDTLLAINLHALNFSLRLDNFRQQLGEIGRLATQHAGPVVVAGDFNTWRTGRLRVADSLLAKAGLVRLDFGAAEARKRRAFGHALDHVYYSPTFLRPDPAGCAVPTGYRTSDHFPLIATFDRFP
jgi:endonuclease/exonuclease/phosphatase (EEP) superfamily protein YafD